MFFRVTEGVGAPSDLSEETTLPIGAQSEIWARLVSLFPNASLEPSSHAGWLDPIELMGNITFHDKSNRSFSASRIERSTVHAVCDALGLVALDPQKYELIFPRRA